MDCRGLEFIEFKPDVSVAFLCSYLGSLRSCREIGKPRVPSPPLNSKRLISLMVNGTTTTRRPAKRLASRRSAGTLDGRDYPCKVDLPREKFRSAKVRLDPSIGLFLDQIFLLSVYYERGVGKESMLWW